MPQFPLTYRPQTLSNGARDWMDLPDGQEINPFEDAAGPQPSPEEIQAMDEKEQRKAMQEEDMDDLRRDVEADPELTPDEKKKWLGIISDAEREAQGFPDPQPPAAAGPSVPPRRETPRDSRPAPVRVSDSVAHRGVV